MKTREIQCEFYEYEGQCSKGKEGTFYKHCQICSTYCAKKGGRPARRDNRRKKMDRIMKKEKWD